MIHFNSWVMKSRLKRFFEMIRTVDGVDQDHAQFLKYQQGEFIVELSSTEGDPRYFKATTYHQSCPDIELGWCWSASLYINFCPTMEYPAAVVVHLPDRKMEKVLERDVEKWADELEESMVKQALEMARSNLKKLRGEK